MASRWQLAILACGLLVLLGACTPKEPRISEYTYQQTLSGGGSGKLTQLKGTARPGWPVFVQYRQRRLGPQQLALGTKWGEPILDDQWKNLAPAVMPNGDGLWSVSVGTGTTVNLVPSAPVSPASSTQNGVFTEFRLTALNPESFEWSAYPPPAQLSGFHVYQTGGIHPQVQSEARVVDFEFAAVGASDGPTDCDAPGQTCAPSSTADDADSVLQTFDAVREEEVAWAASDWNPADDVFPLFPPHAAVASPAGFAGNPNHEYPFVFGLVQGSRPGYAFLATAVTQRPDTPNFNVGVSGKIKVKVKVGFCWFFC